MVAWVADSFELASGPVGARSEPFGSSNLECTGSSCAHSFPGLSASRAGCSPRAKISDYFPLSQNLNRNSEWWSARRAMSSLGEMFSRAQFLCPFGSLYELVLASAEALASPQATRT